MKLLAPLLIFFAVSAASLPAHCDPSPAPSASPIAVSSAQSPAPPMVQGVVAVAEPAAPPSWAQDLMVSAQKLPIVGPIVSKALLYVGILGSILTMLCGFLMAALSALSGTLQYAGLASAVQKIADFQNGKFMYYLKFFSLFNAKKPDPQ